ncbi:hypothetical protein BGZ72_002076 [Mortierella alpina]|nr:hypothetical protein BGZ72_002076 [Mortierella alpina]
MPLKRSLSRFFKRGKCDDVTEATPCAEDIEASGATVEPLAAKQAHVILQDQSQHDSGNSSMATIRSSMSVAELTKHDKPNGMSLFRSLSTSVARAKSKASGALLQRPANNKQLGASSLAFKAPQDTTLPHKTNTVCGASASQGRLASSPLAVPQRPSPPSRESLQTRAIQSNEHSCSSQEQGLRADSTGHTRPEMAHPHRNGKKLFEELHSDLEPILKTAKSGEKRKRKSAIKRRSLHGTKRVSFASEPPSRKSQLLDPSLAGLVLRTSQRPSMSHRSEKRLSFGAGRRRSALMTIIASQSDSGASDEASVETDMIEQEYQTSDREDPTRSGHAPNHHSTSRACYSDFVRHNTMKRSGHPPADLHGPSHHRRTTSRRRSLLAPAFHCRIQADQQSHTRRRHQRLQDIPSEVVS